MERCARVRRRGSVPSGDTCGLALGERDAAVRSVDEQDLASAFAAILQALVNRDRLGFLG
jgi:hypothetical protein